MIYLYIGQDQIKLLYLKKTILGQQETFFFEKKHEIKLVDKGRVVSVDLLASAVKEALTLTSSNLINEKEIFLILPQDAFYFLRTEVPADIAPSAVTSFIRDKARAVLPVDLDSCISDFFIQENQKQKILTFYATDRNKLDGFNQALTLLDLKITGVLPDTLAYFKLFEKTLRKDKKENILYVSYEKGSLSGYLFDSYGLISQEPWSLTLKGKEGIEEALKAKALEIKEKGNKLNRIILSGQDSEKIRQDTFTKSVGVWTNPLKRIIPNFYQDYLKLIVVDQKKQFPILSLDVCFGAFIFQQENKNFSLLRKNTRILKTKGGTSLHISLPKKEIFLFLSSFALSFLLLYAISKIKLNLSLPQLSTKQAGLFFSPSPSPTPTSTPTPTPVVNKEEIKIKILNGSGVKGKAGELRDILKEKGYQEILTGNADNFDYIQSELQVKKSQSAAAALIEKDLAEIIPDFKKMILDEEETADIIIVLGSDFK